MRLIPLPAQVRVRSVALMVLILGTSLVNVVSLVNTLVWDGNVRDVAPVWCDIATTFSCFYHLSAVSTGLCIARNLQWMSSPRVNNSGRPNRILFEIGFCCFLPLASIPLRYSVAPNRYMILEDLGCLPTSHPSLLAAALVFSPHAVVSLAAFIYSCMAIRNLFRHRSTISEVSNLRDTKSVLTLSRFIRLILLCHVVGLWPLSIVILTLYRNRSHLEPWPGWKAVHASFRHIRTFPIAVQPAELRKSVMITYLTYTINSFVLFATLVFGDAVRGDVRKVWDFFIRKVSRPHADISTTPSQWM